MDNIIENTNNENTQQTKLVSFSTELVKQYSVREAVILQELAFYLTKDKTHQGVVTKGKRWVYHTNKQFEDRMPFCRNVRHILTGLVDKGVLLTQKFDVGHSLRHYAFADPELQAAATQNKYYFDADLANVFDKSGETIAIVYNWFVSVAKARSTPHNQTEWVSANVRHIARDLSFMSHMTVWRGIKTLKKKGWLKTRRNGMFMDYAAVPWRTPITEQIECGKPTDLGLTLEQFDCDLIGAGMMANWYRFIDLKNDTKSISFSPRQNVFSSTSKSSMPTEPVTSSHRNIFNINSSNSLQEFYVKDANRLVFSEDLKNGLFSLGETQQNFDSKNEQKLEDSNEDENAPQIVEIPVNQKLNIPTNNSPTKLNVPTVGVLKKDYSTKVSMELPFTELLNNLVCFDLEHQEYVKDYPLTYFPKYCGKIVLPSNNPNFGLRKFSSDLVSHCAEFILLFVQLSNEANLSTSLTEADILATYNFLAKYPNTPVTTILHIVEFVIGEHKTFHTAYPEQPSTEYYFLMREMPDLTLKLKAHCCSSLVYFFQHFSYFLAKTTEYLDIDVLHDLNPKNYRSTHQLRDLIPQADFRELQDYFQKIANLLGPIALRLEICESWRNAIVFGGIDQFETLRNISSSERETWEILDNGTNKTLSMNFCAWVCQYINKINPRLFPVVTADML